MKINTQTIKKSALGIVSWCVATRAMAVEPLKLPSWVDGDAIAKTSEIGEKIVNYSASLLGICIVIGLGISAYQFSTGDGDSGKKTLKNCLIGGVVTSCSFGFAQFFI